METKNKNRKNLLKIDSKERLKIDQKKKEHQKKFGIKITNKKAFQIMTIKDTKKIVDIFKTRKRNEDDIEKIFKSF